MHHVFVSIGSNIDRAKYICSALDALQENFAELHCSPVYESEAVGFEGDNFYNLVVGFKTDLTLPELAKKLRAIEDANGRDRSAPKFSARTLDLDILSYDNLRGNFAGIVLPREEITRNAFVLKPLADLAGQALHPELKKTYEQLWQEFDAGKQKLWRIDFNWKGQALSGKAVRSLIQEK